MFVPWEILIGGALLCVALGVGLGWFIEEFARSRLKARIRSCGTQLDILGKEIRTRKQISRRDYEELEQLHVIADEAWQRLVGGVKHPNKYRELAATVERVGQYYTTALRIQRIQELAVDEAIDSYIERLRLLDLVISEQATSKAILEDASFDPDQKLQATFTDVYNYFLRLWMSAQGQIFQELTEAIAEDKLESIRDLFKRAGCFKIVGDVHTWKAAIHLCAGFDGNRLDNFWEQ